MSSGEREDTGYRRVLYLAAIISISICVVSLAWLFRESAWSLILFTCAWVLMVSVFAWQIMTRAARLDTALRSRASALEQSNRYLNRLLDVLRRFRRVSYEINRELDMDEVAHTFVDRLCSLFDGVDSAWLWLDRGRLESQPGAAGAGEPLQLARRAGTDLGAVDELQELSRNNPLVARCFQDRSVAVEHELADKAEAWGWPWLAQCGMMSFAAFRLELGKEILGVLGVFSTRTISADFVRQLHLACNQLAVALEKGRLLKALRRRANELARAYEELQELDAMKDWFICSVSHELRTPLTSIISFSEILEQYEDLDGEEHREFAGIIRQESERLALVIDDMLDLSRIARGEMNLEPGDFDMTGLVRRCCRLFSRRAQEQEVELMCDLPPEAHTYADEDAVARVLNNLLSNAFKFTPAGGTVRVKVQQLGPPDNQIVRTTVQDTGPGIPHDQQERIFEKFTQVQSKLTSKPSGSGIGLAICREIVSESGGHIWVESPPGDGSTFVFDLPATSRTVLQTAPTQAKM